MRTLLSNLLAWTILLGLPVGLHAKEVIIPNGKIDLLSTPCENAAILAVLSAYSNPVPSVWYTGKVYFKADDVEHTDDICWRVDLSRAGWAVSMNAFNFMYRFKVFELKSPSGKDS